jgi:hypothetical protein
LETCAQRSTVQYGRASSPHTWQSDLGHWCAVLPHATGIFIYACCSCLENILWSTL